MTEAIERVARAIASCQGDDFDAMHQDKSEWIETRGHAGGRFRSINEPRKEDYLGMAEAAIAAMPGWQAIETAPKDGTHILMYRSLPGKSDCIAEAWWKADVFGDMCWGANGWTYPNFRPPTHWMPLPTPPEVQA